MLDFDYYLKRFRRDLKSQVRQQYLGEIRKMYHELRLQGKSREEIEASVNEFVESRILELGETRRVLFNQSVEKYGELQYPALRDIIVYGKEPIPYWPKDSWRKPKIVEVYRIDTDECVESFYAVYQRCNSPKDGDVVFEVGRTIHERETKSQLCEILSEPYSCSEYYFKYREVMEGENKYTKPCKKYKVRKLHNVVPNLEEAELIGTVADIKKSNSF